MFLSLKKTSLSTSLQDNIFFFDSSNQILKDEDIQEQNKRSVKDSIIFIKYFDPTDNLDHINYENNNVQTALKLDIESYAFAKIHPESMAN